MEIEGLLHQQGGGEDDEEDDVDEAAAWFGLVEYREEEDVVRQTSVVLSDVVVVGAGEDIGIAEAIENCLSVFLSLFCFSLLLLVWLIDRLIGWSSLSLSLFFSLLFSSLVGVVLSPA